MKKLTLILAALTLTLGLSQCKKTETPTTDEGVYITLTAGYGNGAKTDFTPATGSFVWTEDATEYIYVGGSQHDACLGVLSGAGTGTGSMTFSGTLTTTPENGETLHFFYLGKGKNGSAVSTLDFSNQSIDSLASLTNFHIAVGDGSYSNSTVNYATTLHMAVSFAYFNVDGFKNASNATETVYLHGNEVYSTATINYRAGTIAGDAKGNINLGTASSGKYVALIPSVSTETTVSFDSNSKWGALNFMRGIQAGRYYSNNGAALTVTAGTLLAGTVPGLFSVPGLYSSDTKMVRFSKGNLQYIGSAGNDDETNTGAYWKFADNQWDYLNNTNGNNGNGKTVDRDLFCWGTSGYNHGATNYQPWSTTTGFNYLYNAYGNQDANLDGGAGTADWGYNAISNGGNAENSGWRTLNAYEWDHVFSTRSSGSTVNGTSNARYTEATINTDGIGVNGIILFPEGVFIENSEATSWGTINGGSAWGTQCTTAQWTALEAKGCVFLPAAGYRNETSVNLVGSYGYYWSSSHSSNNKVYSMRFYSGNLDSQNVTDRYYGFSVRLIHNAGLIVNTDIVNDVTAGGSIFSGWTNGGGDPWNDPTPGNGGSTLGGWSNEGNDPWGN